jgi:hypothetical protein
MPALKLRSNYQGLLMTLSALLLGILFGTFYCMCGCGGGGGGHLRENGDSDDGSGEVSSGPWKRIHIACIEAGSIDNPRVQASLDSSGKVHIVYFCDNSGAVCPVSSTGKLTGSSIDSSTVDSLTVADSFTVDSLTVDSLTVDNSTASYTVNYMVGSIVLNRQDTYPYYLIGRYLMDQGPECIACTDNYPSLALTLTQDNCLVTQDDCPVVVYRGGTLRGCEGGGGQQQHQSDVMISIRESGSGSGSESGNGSGSGSGNGSGSGSESGSGTWESWIGAEGSLKTEASGGGASEGDSFLMLAGNEVSAVTDSKGCIHLSYQVLSEKCGAADSSANYADLYYVKIDPSTHNAQAASERVEEDQHDSPHFIGSHCAITLDRDENGNETPVIFYYAEIPDQTLGQQVRGLRVARKEGGAWNSENREWIERLTEPVCEIDSISCAKGSQNGYGYMGVAYAIKAPQSGGSVYHHLQYACTDRQFSSWQVQTVDDYTSCGEYCSLAFDSLGFPAIAYRGQSYIGSYFKCLNYAHAHFNESSFSWNIEVVSPTRDITGSIEEDIGLCNNLWLGDNNRPFICSYSSTQKTIYLFYRDPP